MDGWVDNFNSFVVFSLFQVFVVVFVVVGE